MASNVNASNVIKAIIAGIIIGAPLLAGMGLTFMASTSLLLLSSPLLLFFSPLLLFVSFILLLSLAGFGFSTAVAAAGLSSLRRAFKAVGGESGPVVCRRGLETLTESGRPVREEIVHVGKYSAETVEVFPSS
ncbi:Oleosin protein [Dioscorea alata]|uniref:Oleosin protein n=1 Tax=Dioscorea alata TaxID=55571 RepID=A0ACB7VJ39_DIOAL|nr:Oleosin protein [Dioscorea alata]